jgi:hypothetical protein
VTVAATPGAEAIGVAFATVTELLAELVAVHEL